MHTNDDRARLLTALIKGTVTRVRVTSRISGEEAGIAVYNRKTGRFLTGRDALTLTEFDQQYACIEEN